jgi:uridine kinase
MNQLDGTGEYICYCNCLEGINEAVRKDPAGFVERSEKSYRENIESIARRIAGEKPISRLVMIAGPSSSGKTTTAHLLKRALRQEGVGSVSISLDDFYRGENLAPVLPDGSHDYECLEALDVEEVRRCLGELVGKNRCEMPVFDFEQHVRYPHRRQVILGERDVAVVEGIHALNPELIRTLPELHLHRIYISVKQGIVGGSGKLLLRAHDVRLLRRIVRDYNSRKTGPDNTLSMWPNVLRGECRFIKPFRKDADMTINSFHEYELCVLRGKALELLSEVPKDSPNYALSRKLADAVSLFAPIDPALVPRDSIIREFIGGGMDMS